MTARGISPLLKFRRLLPPFVFVVAIAARLGMVYAHGGSLRDSPSYDTSVYYAAADALVHGRLPYRDFTLLHPPGIMLALAPLAALGRLTTDHIGFMVGNVAWMLLGATNSLLVLRIARRMQSGTTASAIGGLGYALWYESSRSEYAVRLEPLGNFFLLLGILAFVASARSDRRLVSMGCGAALSAAANVKIWYLVPMLIVLAWHLIDRRPRRQLAWSALGAIAASAALSGPFVLLTGTRMWQMVISDQLGRNRGGATSFARLTQLASSGQVGTNSSSPVIAVVTLLGALLFIGLCALAWRAPAGRLITTLAIAQLAVIEIAPPFFPYYSDYLTPSMALTVAAAAACLVRDAAARPVLRRRLLRSVAWLPIALIGGSALAADVFQPLRAVAPAPDQWLQHAVASARCVQSDSPMALIQLNALSRDLANNCQLWVDVTGRTYTAPLKPTGRVNGKRRRRTTYPPWQHALLGYLLSGNDVVVIQPHSTGISRHTLREINRGGTVGKADGYVVRRR